MLFSISKQSNKLQIEIKIKSKFLRNIYILNLLNIYFMIIFIKSFINLYTQIIHLLKQFKVKIKYYGQLIYIFKQMQKIVGKILIFLQLNSMIMLISFSVILLYEKKLKQCLINQVEVNIYSLCNICSQIISFKFLQQQMKINFDQLFGDARPLQKSNSFKKTIHQSQASTNNGIQQQFRKSQLISKNQSRIKKANSNNQYLGRDLGSSKFYKKSANQVMRVLQSNNKNQHMDYRWYKQAQVQSDSRSKQQIQMMRLKNSKEKQLSRNQILSLTKRLNQHCGCNKPSCKKNVDLVLSKRLKQEFLPLGVPIRDKKLTLTQTCQFLKNNHSQLHQRLYQQYKSRIFRQNQLKQKYNQRYIIHNAKRPIENASNSYSYIPFYSRLDWQINRRKKKQQFYDKNVISNGQILNFSPDISVGMNSLHYVNSSVSITPRKQKNQIKGRAQMKFTGKLTSSLDGSLNSSLQKSLTKSCKTRLNKSVQIVQKKQQKLLIKILALFQQDGYFVMKPQKIQYLDQVEFQIFFPLIAQMQQYQKIPIDIFQKTLRKYFQSLSKYDKYSLRNNQRQKQKYIKIQNQNNTSKKSVISFKLSDNKSKLKNTGSKNSNANSDYLVKIQNFV